MNGLDTSIIEGYANSITGLINDILVPALIAVAFLVFLWGIYKYFIQGADNEEARTTGKVFTLYGLIGFVVLFSVWGIVQIFMGTLNIGAANAPAPPTIGGSSGGSSNASGAYFPSTNVRTGGTSGRYNIGTGSYGAGGSPGNTYGGAVPIGECMGGVGGTCPIGYRCSSGFCISDSSTGSPGTGTCDSSDQNDCYTAGGTYSMSSCTCTPANSSDYNFNNSSDFNYYSLLFFLLRRIGNISHLF